jgi:hypothetical protein
VHLHLSLCDGLWGLDKSNRWIKPQLYLPDGPRT